MRKEISERKTCFFGSKRCLFNANGATSIEAWGSAPGSHSSLQTSAESALHSSIESRLERLISMLFKSWDDVPGWGELAPLALTDPPRQAESAWFSGGSH
jgi:hypothetical protein